MSANGIDHFTADLELLVDRMRDEYDMCYAELIGCLEAVKIALALEMFEETEEEEPL